MQSRAEILRRRISLYRKYLSEGATSELAIIYLREIASATAELTQIENSQRRS